MVNNPQAEATDRGAVLVLTLILTVVMSVIVLALASYATVGLKTSDVASERTETNVDSANVMSWAIEQFSKKRMRPETPTDCGDAPTYVSTTPPAGLATNGSTTMLECARTNPISGDPVVHLRATSIGDQTRTIEATLEVPQYTHGARISDWRVDIPIAVPPYTPPPPPGGNVDPVANTTLWSVAPGSSTTQILDASDSDGTIVSAAIDGLSVPAGWTVVPTGGTSVDLTVPITELPGTYSMNFTVTDDDGATDSSTIQVDVTFVAPPPPAPACTFTVTSSSNGGKNGNGTLSVSNTSGQFVGFEVQVSQTSSSKPWTFTWDSAVTVTSSTNSFERVAGTQTLNQNDVLNVNAALVQPANGQPKINTGDTLTCAVLSP